MSLLEGGVFFFISVMCMYFLSAAARLACHFVSYDSHLVKFADGVS